MRDLPKGSPILCVDFDGVIHSYDSGWKGPRKIPDPPVPGAIDWLYRIIWGPEFRLAIYSSRSRYFGGKRAMKRWLVNNGLPAHSLEFIMFPTRKPPAFLQIDDRALTFNGKFPSIKEMQSFKPWNRRTV